VLAEWITGPENPYFAPAIVNRLWKYMMGRGLIEPTDDIRPTNPPTHPALLDYLARDFVEHGYRLRHTLRTIALSETYARSTTPTGSNTSGRTFYSHALVRPLESEVLADAISQVTGVSTRYGDLPQGTRAIALADPAIAAPELDLLGRCSREQSCESLPHAITLKQSLHMINGALINSRLADADGRLQKLLTANKTDQQIVREFYAAALARPPSPDESAYWAKQLTSTDRQARSELLEDFVWSLLVCREFVTNH
jgi:hypothetical protein